VPRGAGAPANVPAIVALVLGIVGILMTIVSIGFLGWLGFLVGIPAIILGVIGRRKVDRGETTQARGVATAGLWTGIAAVVLGLLLTALYVVGFALLSASSGG